MALSAASVFEVQTGGNDTNGGGFVTGAAGTDYSLVAAKRTATGANDSTTDAVAVGTDVITSATAAFTSAIVGNIISMSGGTGTLAQGWYQVITFTSATSITVERNVAAGTGITMNIGGALASPGMAGGVGLVAGNIIYIKAGTYTIASATPNIATGCFSATGATFIEGYQTTRGDLGTRPLLQASGISTFTIISVTGSGSYTRNIELDGAGLTSSRGILQRGVGSLIKASNCTNSGFVLSTDAVWIRCEATGCSTANAFASGAYIACVARDNTISGFGAVVSASHCIAYDNSGAASDGFVTTAVGNRITNCIAYTNGRDGFRLAVGAAVVVSCIAEGNAGVGFRVPNNDNGIQLLNCAGFNSTNLSLGTGKFVFNIGFKTLTGSPFTAPASDDFSLNTTSGAGADCRAAGYPGVLPIGGTGYLDIGTLQHQDPAGGSGGGMRLAGTGGLAVG